MKMHFDFKLFKNRSNALRMCPTPRRRILFFVIHTLTENDSVSCYKIKSSNSFVYSLEGAFEAAMRSIINLYFKGIPVKF